MDGIDTSGKRLVAHWKWAADKGLMNANTASSLQAACSQILGELDDWETLDIRALDTQDAFRRFQNKRSKDFAPASLETYRRRFNHAVKLFLKYADDPSGWRPPSRGTPVNGSTPRKSKKASRMNSASDELEVVTDTEEAASVISRGGALVQYPYPLREGRLAYLRLPVDLKMAEVERLHAYLKTLAIDGP